MIFKIFKIFASNIFTFSTFLNDAKKDKNGIVKVISFAFLSLYVIFTFCNYYIKAMASTYQYLFSIGETTLMPLLAVLIAFVVIVFFGFISVASNYYTGHGEEQFLSMPINSTQFFGAKFGVSFMTDAGMGIFLFSIAAFVYGRNENLLTNPLFYLGTLITDLAFSVISIAAIYFILILILYFLPKLRKRSILNAISTICVFVFAICYGFAVSRISMAHSSSGAGDFQSYSSMVGFAMALAEEVPFFKFISTAIEGNIFAILTLLAISALVIFAFIPFLGKLYIKTLNGFSDEKSKKLSKEKAGRLITKDVHSGSIFKALYWRDVKTVLREPTFFANGPLMVFLMPAIFIISFAFAITAAADGSFSDFRLELVNQISEFTTENFDKFKYFVSMGFATFTIFIGNAANLASSSFSREGKSLYDLKAMPIQSNLITKAKFWHAFTYVIIACLISGFSIIILNLVLACPFSAGQIIKILWLMSLNAIAVSLVLIFVEMFIDTANPKLDWENPVAAFKQNLNSLLSMFITIVVLAIAIVFGIFILPKNDSGQLLFTGIFVIIAAPIGAKYFKYAEKKIQMM